MAFHIVRHGRTEANAGGVLLGRADPGLDPTGVAQADALATAVPDDAIVVSSPLVRCRETAERIAVVGNRSFRVDDRLMELDYGEFDLVAPAELGAETWARWRADPHFRPPGGETLHELGLRVSACLDHYQEWARDGEVVLVTHVSPIKAAVAWALGVGVEVSWRCFVAQASLSRVSVTERGPSLHLFNSTEHLSGLSH